MLQTLLPARSPQARLRFALFLPRTWLALPLALGLTLLCTTVMAEPLDAAADAKIDESMNVHYLGTKFRKAEAVLLGTIKACGDSCSGAVIARAWMYIGIVRGVGNGDIKGAKKAFAEAVNHDAFVRLDHDLTTKEVTKAFEDAGGDSSKPARSLDGLEPDEPAPPPDAVAGPSRPTSPDGPMSCGPIVNEVETRRPIPVSCRSGRPVRKVALYYKEFGANVWNQVNMNQTGADWIGQIPCTGTTIQGTLRWYVVGMAADATPIDSFGSESEPTLVDLVAETSAAPPSIAGRPPPQRCSESADCPPEMIGTPSCPGRKAVVTTSSKSGLAWGAACEAHVQCEEGLFCIGGSCDMAPACSSDEDCTQGSCNGEVCEIDRDADVNEVNDNSQPSGLLSFNFGLDLTMASGDGICNPHEANDDQWDCYLGDSPYATPVRDPAMVAQDLSGSFGYGPVPGTMRGTIGYEYLFGKLFGVEVQAGMAFNKSPTAELVAMIHGSLRLKYWFLGAGRGFKPYLALGGGLGEVNALKVVATREFYEETDQATFERIDAMPISKSEKEALYDEFLASKSSKPSAYTALACPQQAGGQCLVDPVNAWNRFGSSFVSLGLGSLLNFGGFGISVEVQGKYMLPKSAIVAQPTLGLVFPL